MKFSTPEISFAPALVAAVLAMLALQGWFEYQLLAPVAVEVRQLGADLQALDSTRATVKPPVSPPQVRLQGILARLEQQPDLQARIERMHIIVARNAVVLRKASYQNQSNVGDILRHEIQADLSGSYPALRQFLRELMAQDEALAVESLEFSRPVGSVGIRAQVRLVLFSKP
jgi:hypothetical protein